jgi:hypothetical protein
MNVNLNELPSSPSLPPSSTTSTADPVMRTLGGDDVGELSDVRFDPGTGHLRFAVDLYAGPLVDELRHYDRVREDRWGREQAGWAMVGIVIIAVLIGTGFWVYRQGVTGTSSKVQQAAAVLERTSVAVRGSASDATTTAKVKTALALSKRVHALDVNVDTKDSVATLTGRVSSTEAKDIAGQIAADTSGVREVRNLLTVDDTATP